MQDTKIKMKYLNLRTKQKKNFSNSWTTLKPLRDLFHFYYINVSI